MQVHPTSGESIKWDLVEWEQKKMKIKHCRSSDRSQYDVTRTRIEEVHEQSWVTRRTKRCSLEWTTIRTV
jgi:ribosomal protein L34E